MRAKLGKLPRRMPMVATTLWIAIGCSAPPPDAALDANDTPANTPTTFETLQPDGRIIELQAANQEYYDWSSANGYTVVQDPKGQYQYAQRTADGTLEPSGLVVGENDPADHGFVPNILPDEMVIEQIQAGAAARQDIVLDPEDLDLPDGWTLFEGDMIVPEQFLKERNGERSAAGTYVEHAFMYWTDGVVPYTFDNVSAENQARVLAAMAEWEARARVEFVPRTNQANYLVIGSYGGNWSYLGMMGGGQQLSIYNWSYKYIICHELAHAMGLYHEQSRVDRDQYIRVNYENIQSGREHNFNKYASALTECSHDFDSVMHYSRQSFSKNGLDTITCLSPYEAYQNTIGHRTHLSVCDAATMATIYGSPNPTAHSAAFGTDEDTPLSGSLSATPPDDSPLTYGIVSNGQHGVATVTDASTGAFSYAPNPGSNGNIDSFTFKAWTASAESLPATVTVSIFDGGIFPADGSTLAAGSQTFYWKPVSGATSYSLSLGTTVGSGTYFNQNVGNSLSQTITGLPSDGRALHMRLSAQVNGVWQSTDYTYAARDAAARLTSHSDADHLDTAEVSFSWNSVQEASEYYINIGSSVGAWDYGHGRHYTNTATVGGIPTDGRTIYFRLETKISGVWNVVDYVFTAGPDGEEGGGGGGSPTPAALTSHADGDALGSAQVTFTWNSVAEASEYYIDLGSSTGAWNYHAGRYYTNTATIGGIPTDGRTVYFRLETKIAGTWYHNDYTFTAGAGEEEGGGEEGGGGGGSPTPAALTSHSEGDALETAQVTFTWNSVAEASEYYIDLGSSTGAWNYHAGRYYTNTATIGGIPTDGRTVYFRLETKIAGTWYHNDYTFTAGAGEEEGGGEEGGGGGGSPTPAALTSHSDGDALETAQVTFTWNSVAEASEYYIDLGSSTGAWNYHAGRYYTNTATIGGIPTDGRTVYFRLETKIAGTWYHNDYTFTAGAGEEEGGGEEGGGGGGSPTPAALTSHSDGDALETAQVTFTWNSVAEASEYYIDLGSSTGAWNYHAGRYYTNTATIGGIPTDGRTVYFRLETKIAGTWYHNDYTFTAGAGEEEGGGGGGSPTPAALTSHTDGDALGTAQVTFTWNEVLQASQYYVTIGSGIGTWNYYYGRHFTNSATISGVPTDGRTIYVRLETKIDGVWYHNDYAFTTGG